MIAREARKENRKELDNMLAQIARERAAHLPPPARLFSLEEQFQNSIQRIRQDVQKANDVQTAHILSWLRS